MQLGLGLVPVVPLLLLPFIFIVFVIVFPLWVLGLAVVGLVLVIFMAADKVARAMNMHFLESPARAIRLAFRWVLTFGGLARSQAEREALAASRKATTTTTT